MLPIHSHKVVSNSVNALFSFVSTVPYLKVVCIDGGSPFISIIYWKLLHSMILRKVLLISPSIIEDKTKTAF